MTAGDVSMNISARAKKFAQEWKDRGRERSESQPFWLALLRDVYGIEKPEEYIRFEEPVQLGHKSFIDGFIDATHVIIEQKSLDKDLNEPIKQSDGTFLTPYQQAQRYSLALPYSKRPRWIIACNFKEFHIYDMENPQAKPEIILLENLETEYYRLNFLIDKTSDSIKRELELSIKAGEIVGKLYDALHKQYINPDDEESLKSLNKLCVRLVFCLYAESAGIFGKRNMFRDYLQSFREKNIRRAIIDLFEVLNTPTENRDPYMEDDLAAFPYVNGGLFDEDNIEIPKLTTKIVDLLIRQASEDFDWSGISPTIFGAVFESTLNPITRRSSGMHYTSISNIHKLIDPLFLDDLHDEFETIKTVKTNKKRQQKLQAFQDKLASLKFLDPACGSGNFLTETYLSLRRLENEVLKELIGGQITLGELADPIKVSISQFYGIEINDFAVTVAKTALWIAESQMMSETAEIVHRDLNFLPLKTYTNIEEGNALQMDWYKVAPQVNYIMGNPPFVGYKLQTELQKQDLRPLLGEVKNIDYVAGWYYRAAEYMKNTNIKAAFVSTNSICQGEQVTAIWKRLINENGIHIDFCYRTFQWNSESTEQAAVHCVIVGFSVADCNKEKRIYAETGKYILAENINPYLIDAPTIFIEKRSRPLCEVENMIYGSEPREGGYLLLNEDERQVLLNETPAMGEYVKRFVSSNDFINNQVRYCLWLKNADMRIVRKSKIVMKRLEDCAKFREGSKQKQAHAAKDTPYLFASERQPETKYLLIPIVSSENRRYIPIGYMEPDVIVSNACFTISNASLYTFGVLNSNVHMAWMRTVCGRLKSDYRYSNTLVYNNFVWAKISDEQKRAIEKTAQGILEEISRIQHGRFI